MEISYIFQYIKWKWPVHVMEMAPLLEMLTPVQEISYIIKYS